MPIPSYHHVEVFATRPLTGNGLAVFLHTQGWPAPVMQRLTQEMKQFESIFLSEITAKSACARVFTVEEELAFAAHPVLGAAAVLHQARTPDAHTSSWTLRLPAVDVPVTTRNMGDHWRAEMNQAAAYLGGAIAAAALQPVLARRGSACHRTIQPVGCPAQVISTGLPQLIVPVHPEALARAAITGTDLELLRAALGAKFVLVLGLDFAGLELRTWDNLGRVEDSDQSPLAATRKPT